MRVREDAQVFLGRQNLFRFVIEIGGDDDFRKNLGNRFGGFAIQGPVAGNDAAKRTDRIAGEGALIRCQQIGAERNAAGVGMFDDRNRRTVGKLRHQFKRRVGVVEVVVAELLALNLNGARNADALRVRYIERRRLMRVFAVTQALPLGCGKR